MFDFLRNVLAFTERNADGIIVCRQHRKLRVKWTPDLARDLEQFHSLNAANEIEREIARHLADEIDREILHDLIELVPDNVGFGISGRRTEI